MDNSKLLKLNNFVNQAYECLSFNEFLKLSIMKLHELVMYDSAMFFCGISKDCSYFKPYIGGRIEEYYKKQIFPERENYLQEGDISSAGNEAYVYKASELMQGIIQIVHEPRGGFLAAQKDFHIACIRIIYNNQFLGEIYLHRGKDKPDFDDEELFTLRLLQPHVSTVFNIIHTITAVKYLEASQPLANKLGMCAFDRDLSIAGGNVAGIEMLKTITVFGSSVLYHIKEMCYDLMSDEVTNKAGCAVLSSEVIKTPNGDLKVDLFINNSANENKNIRYVIIMQYGDENQNTGDYKFKFTKREGDIIDGLIQGKNNLQLAEALHISENTIKTHIKRIYKKTGASNRTELTYVLMLNRE